MTTGEQRERGASRPQQFKGAAMSESTAELVSLRAANEIAAQALLKAQGGLYGIAKVITEDWKQGAAPEAHALELLMRATDAWERAVNECLRISEEVNAVYDKQMRPEACRG